MADIKWSAFPATAAGAASGDTLVGLHSAANYQFTLSPNPVALAIAQRDANANLAANNYLAGYRTTATAAATTTLTVSDAYNQYFTGATTQTVVLPVTSTLTLGQSFYIVNNSTGVVTVQSSGANTIQAMAANTALLVTCTLTSGTTAASWNAEYSSAGGGSVATGTINQIGYFAADGNIISGLGPGSSGQLLQSNGVGSAPAYTTATYPATAGTAGTILRSNGSNIVNSTATFADTYAINTILYNASANTVNGLATANNGILVTSAGGVPSIGNTVGAGLTMPSITFNSTSGVIGTATNNNAAAGSVGETISSVIANASPVTMTSNSATNLTSINLTAGDWDVWGNISFLSFGTNPAGLFGWVSSSSATAPDNSLLSGPSYTVGQTFSSPYGFAVPQLRFSLSTTTTIYISAFLSNTSGDGTACGGIYARRRR